MSSTFAEAVESDPIDATSAVDVNNNLGVNPGPPS